MTPEQIAGMPNPVKRYIQLYRGCVTIIVRDDGPFIHLGDTPSYRTIKFALTDEQIGVLRLYGDEYISKVIMEPKVGGELL